MSVSLAYINLLIDLLIICLTIHKTGSWGEWITGTVLYLPGAILSAYPAHMAGIGGEVAIIALWSPLVLLVVRVKVEITQRSSATPRKLKRSTDLEVILGTLIVFACMMLSIWMSF